MSELLFCWRFWSFSVVYLLTLSFISVSGVLVLWEFADA